jgi:hypothetical protein
VPNDDLEAAGVDDRFDVGLNYGAPSVRFRARDWLYFDAEALTSLTEVGFSVGAGGAALIGDPFGQHLMFGWETVQVFGTRFFLELALPANDWLTLTPNVELTNMPHADRFGLRLTLELGAELGAGFAVAARGGYQARAAAEGGVNAGASLSYGY